jgi:hypothetical protein
MYDKAADGKLSVTGLRIACANKEQIVKADAYVAALDVPGAKRLMPEVGGALQSALLQPGATTESGSRRGNVHGQRPPPGLTLRPGQAWADDVGADLGPGPDCALGLQRPQSFTPLPPLTASPPACPAAPQAWRSMQFFDNIHKLVGVAVITVQLR